MTASTRRRRRICPGFGPFYVGRCPGTRFRRAAAAASDSAAEERSVGGTRRGFFGSDRWRVVVFVVVGVGG